MQRKYWLDLFTGKTWEEFIKSGAKISGFKSRRRKLASTIKIGDYLLGYITGISRFIAILEIKSEMFIDETKIWEDTVFPVRFKVDLIKKLTPETAVPIIEMKERLSFFKNSISPNSWTGFFRGSPVEIKKEDAEIIIEELHKAYKNPIKRQFDEKKYWRVPKTYESSIGSVTIPDEHHDEEESKPSQEVDRSEDYQTHEEIQWLLLKLGSDLGLSVWVAKNDRNRSFKGNDFRELKNLIKVLPRQFDEATNKTIELIDVLWLQGDAIIAAFEVEHTSAIYSGLLRMSDLISMQPNIKINLYIVAPDERRDKVITEINRPTFSKLKPALPKICKFIPYSEFKKLLSQVGDKVRYMKTEFIEIVAESCETEEV